MKIAIDMQTTLGQKTGIGFYVDNLVRWLEKLDGEYEYTKLMPESHEDFKSLKRLIWDQFKVPFRSNRARADLLHQPGFSAPIIYTKPVVVTVHDLIAIHFGREIPLGSRLYFGKWMPFSYRFSDHIIAVSEYTKQDLIKLLGFDAKKITVIPLAADERYQPLKDEGEIKKIKAKFNLKDQVILHVGTLNPRKNLEFLVRCFALVKERLNESIQLVITGKKGWYYDDLFKLVAELRLDDDVIFTGYVTDEEKVALYSAAHLLAFPSRYEGFGLPPLEAMQCGTPVIASNTSSIPEVVGNAGILLSPDDKNGWVIAMERLLTDSAERGRLARLGFSQAAKFSWERTAKETRKVYEKVIG